MAPRSEPGPPLAPPAAPTLPPPASRSATMTPSGLLPPPPPPAPTLPEAEAPILVVPPTGVPLRPWEERAERSAAAAMARRASLEGAVANRSRLARFGPPVAPTARMVALALALVASVTSLGWFVVTALHRRSLMVDVRDGRPVSVADMASADDRMATASTVTTVVSVVAFVALVVWMHRAYRSVSVWQPTSYSLGWTVFGWVVPILGLVRPMRIMMEIVDGSSPEGRRPGAVIVWWLLWIVPGLASYGIWSIDPETPSDFVLYDSLLAAAALTIATATVVLLAFTARATADQRHRVELAGA